MPSGIGRIAKGSNFGTLWIAGENTNAYYYNVNQDVMIQTKGTIGTATVGGSCGVAVGTKFYIIGGSSGTFISTIQIYNTLTDTWSNATSTVSGGITLACCAAMNGKVYIFGGQNAAATTVTTCWVFDPGLDTITSIAPIPGNPIQASQAVAYNGLIYMIAGMDTVAAAQITTNQVYNPATNAWSTKTACLSAVQNSSLVVLNDFIYLIGGAAGGNGIATVQRYNALADSWSNVASLPANTQLACCAAIGGAIYCIGGQNTVGTTVKTAYRYNPANNSWKTLTAPTVFFEQVGIQMSGNGLTNL